MTPFINRVTYINVDAITYPCHKLNVGITSLAYLIIMLCTAQLGGPVLKASGRVQFSLFQLGDEVPHDQRPAHSRGLSKPIKPTGQALTLINPFHKRHYYIISDITINYFGFI